MQVTKGQIHDAMDALVHIGERQGVRIPQMGSFRLKQLHAALEKAAEEIFVAQQELVLKYGREMFLDEPANTKPSGQFGVVDNDKKILYNQEWNAIRQETLDLEVKPISIALFGTSDHGLEMKELVLLGPFVEEPKE